MTHVHDALIDYHYGELPPDERAAVALHLSECPDCARAYCRLHAELEGLGAALQASPGPEVGRQLQARVVARFKPPLLTRIARAFTLRIPAYAAAAVLLLAVGLTVWLRPADPAQPSPLTTPSTPTETGPGDPGAPGAPVIDGYDASQLLSVDQIHVL